MHILKEQLGRISHFLIIMIPLFIVNAIFNLSYNWGGVSAIARVYIMVLSFYLIFIFSQINPDDYRNDYTTRYGWKGKYYLFFTIRIFPFLFIYFLTIVFTMINYLKAPNWPFEPAYKLLDGRYSNTIFYSLILFVVLRQGRRPRISIPLFIIFSIIYFVTDHALYALLEPGIGVNFIKLIKYFFFIFILTYGYVKSHLGLLRSVLLSVFGGSFLFMLILSFIIFSFYIAPFGSSTLSVTGRILLKSGFVFTLDKLQKNILENGNSDDTTAFFEFVEKYGKDTSYSIGEWENIILKNKLNNIEYIFIHLNRKNIKLNFETLKTYTVSQMLNNPPDLIKLTQFTSYFSSYYVENKDEFYNLYKTGNESMKIFILESLSYTNDIAAINFLIDKLTNVERTRSDRAYESLKKITGHDPAKDLNREKYNIEVVLFFRDYASKMIKQTDVHT